MLRFLKDFIDAHFSDKKAIGLTLALFFLIICLALYVFLNLPDGKLHIFFFDVGQGDSILIQGPKNQRILIDGGPDEGVLTSLGEVLPFYDKTLDLVVLTHPHADHITGLIEVLRRYKTDLVLANKTGYQTPETNQFWEVIDQKGIPRRGLTMGESIELGKVKLDILWPPKDRVNSGSSNPNLDSIVLRLQFADFSTLLIGDAEAEVQQELILLDRMPLVTPILKTPHQGAGDCCDKEFIRRLKPQLAVISVGDNRFGHPSSETISLLENLGVKVLRTDQEGTIEVVSDGKNWWLKTGGK